MPSGTLRTMLSLQKSFLAAALSGALLAGCGSSSTPHTTSGGAQGGSNGQASGGASGQASGGASGQGALAADARSAATGDIPDNQVFLVFSNAAAGYSIKYPEGWTQRGAGASVTFQDKNNLARVLVRPGGPPSASTLAAQLQDLKRTDPSLTFQTPQSVKLPSGPAVKAVYTTQSAPNPVTGKRVTLIVNRYLLSHGGRIATVDLGTPTGVDNKDAYRMMIASFRWG